MKKWFSLLLIVPILFGIFLLCDKIRLTQNCIRLHVVAASDEAADQAIKLRVKDAVVSYLQPLMQEFADSDRAKAFLRQELPKLTEIANAVLDKWGVADRAKVSLTREEFGIREYDTFMLPSGVYSSLRIVIGEGEGKNWWCVVFPSLCMPATTQDFADKAVGAGFSDSLTGSLTGKYEIRFYLLDCLGRLENFFHRG